MRTFPGARRTRVAVPVVGALTLASLAIASLSYAAPTLPNADPDDLRDRQKSVQSQVDRATEALEQSSSAASAARQRWLDARDDLVGARATLAGARDKVIAARAEDARLAEALTKAKAELTSAKDALAEGRAEVARQKKVVADTVTSYYQNGDPSLLALGALMSDDPADATRQMQVMDTVVGQQDDAYDDLVDAEAELAATQRRVAAAEKDVSAQRQAAAEHFAAVRSLRNDAVDAEADVADKVTAAGRAEHDADAAKQADQAELAKLRAEEARIKKLIAEAAARDARAGYSGPTGGLLEAPVNGAVTSPYGYREHPIYHYWGLHDGTDFGAGCGSPLVAVAGGTVLERTWSDVYGNRLYLNIGTVNGKNLTAVYNHATDYTVSVGQTVKRGQTLGHVGSTGWSTGCHLHFTVLSDGSPVDPMTLIGG